MDIKADDPIEAILTEADRRNMNVFLGIGMFAWFDFTTESLEWHKRVAKRAFGEKVWTSRVLLWVLYFGREWRRAR